MKPLKISLAAIVLAAGVQSTQAGATSPAATSERSDINVVKNYDPRLSGYNAAGLHILPVKKVSVAEVYFQKADGGFVNYHQSDDSYTWGLRTESFFRANSNIVMSGKVEYNNVTGRNMGGSTFLDPYYNPFDIIEMDGATVGKKRTERYHLVGAVSARVARGLHLGGKIDYTAANYTKFVDLRHKSKYMDLTATAGASYAICDVLEIGASYLYRRSTEEIAFAVYGNTDKQYYSLISFGSFIGRREGVDDTGYTAKGKNKPVFNEFHGGSLQLTWSIAPSASLFGEFTYKSRSGYYGVRSPQSIVFTDHGSDIFEYRAGLNLRGEHLSHSFSFTAADERLDNYENIYREQMSETGGSSDIIYFGKVKMLERNVTDMRLEYEGQTGWQGFDSRWTFGAMWDYYSRSQVTSLYPYYRKQNLESYTVAVSGGHNIRSGVNGYKITAGLSFGSGSGTEKKDGVYVAPSTGSNAPVTMDDMLMCEFEYLTANRIGASLGFRYTRELKNGISGYAALEGTFAKAFDLSYIPKSTHGTVTIKIGCSF